MKNKILGFYQVMIKDEKSGELKPSYCMIEESNGEKIPHFTVDKKESLKWAKEYSDQKGYADISEFEKDSNVVFNMPEEDFIKEMADKYQLDFKLKGSTEGAKASNNSGQAQVTPEQENNGIQYIPGTTIPRPRDRKVDETEEDYEKYLDHYYNVVIADDLEKTKKKNERDLQKAQKQQAKAAKKATKKPKKKRKWKRLVVFAGIAVAFLAAVVNGSKPKLTRTSKTGTATFNNRNNNNKKPTTTPTAVATPTDTVVPTKTEAVPAQSVDYSDDSSSTYSTQDDWGGDYTYAKPVDARTPVSATLVYNPASGGSGSTGSTGTTNTPSTGTPIEGAQGGFFEEEETYNPDEWQNAGVVGNTGANENNNNTPETSTPESETSTEGAQGGFFEEEETYNSDEWQDAEIVGNVGTTDEGTEEPDTPVEEEEQTVSVSDVPGLDVYEEFVTEDGTLNPAVSDVTEDLTGAVDHDTPLPDPAETAEGNTEVVEEVPVEQTDTNVETTETPVETPTEEVPEPEVVEEVPTEQVGQSVEDAADAAVEAMANGISGTIVYDESTGEYNFVPTETSVNETTSLTR